MKRRLLLCLLATQLSVVCRDAAAETAKKFFLLYSVNNGGYIDVCGCKRKKVKQGSLARRITLINALRAAGKPFLLLDGGSCFFAIQNKLPKTFERKQFLAKAFVIAESYNRMGYQAVALGSSDLLMGLDHLKRVAQAATFPILSANFLGSDGKPVFKPWTVLEVAGVRVGVIGLIMNTLSRRYLEKIAPGCSVADSLGAAKQAVAELKGKTDLIVALSHMRKEENEQLAKAVPEISIIFDPNINYGSHSMIIADSQNYVDRFEDTLVVRCEGEGMRLSRVDIEFEVPLAPIRTSDTLNRLGKGVHAELPPTDMIPVLGRGDFNRGAITRLSVEAHILANPGILALVDQWKRLDPGALDPKDLAKVKGKPMLYAGKEACKECHEEQYDFWLKTHHAKAFASLEQMGDHLRYDCIGCHTVGFGRAFVHVKDAKKFADVQCECCHGTNVAHVKEPLKAPKWPPVTEYTCLVCHNESQIRLPFDYHGKRKLVACPRMEE